MHYALLPQRALMSLFGEDTVPFLQGLVSNDVTKLKEGAAMYAALLSPQGKFLHDFFLYKRGEAILLDIDKARLPDLVQRLKMYKLRSKVAIEVLPESEGVVAVWGIPSPLRGEELFADPRLPELGCRIVGDRAKIKTFCEEKKWQAVASDAYDRMRLELGVPDGARDMIIDRSFLLEFGFEDLHGVDFNKGCYVGQEVTARSKFRAQLRKSLYQVKSDGAELPPPGTRVTAGGTEIGELRSHSGDTGLAILRIEEVGKATAPLMAAGVTIASAAIPNWIASPPSSD